MSEAKALLEIAPHMVIVGLVIKLVGLCLIIWMLGKVLSFGVSLAFADFLYKYANQDVRERLIRWCANGNEILEELRKIDEKLGKTIKKSKE